MLALLALWASRIKSRNELANLPSRLLQDIGYTKTDAMQEANKPFWAA